VSVFERPAVLVVTAVSLAVVLAIGWLSARRTHDARDFYVAGRRLGLWVTTLAAMSAAFSGFVFLGGPGLTYRLGVSSLFINAPLGFTAALLCWTLGKRLRLLAHARETYTLSDALAARYDSRWAAAAGAVAVVVGSLGYLGAQIQALGVLVSQVFGLEAPALAMTVGLLVVLVYTVAGGMTAGVYTDLFQGILMMGGAVAVFAHALGAGGGWRGITGALAASAEHGEAFLLPAGTVPWATVLGFFFVFGVGVLGQPQMLHKFFMLRDPRQLRYLPLALGGSQAVCLLIWIGVGLAVPALVATGKMPPLTSPDEAAPAFLLAFTPDLLAGVVVAGVLAAVMSTADSFLLLGAAALVRDLPRAWGRPVTDELLWGRRAMVVFAVLAALFAHLYDDLIALLGTFAFGTFAAALTPALAVGFNWKRVTAPAATASIVTGVVANLGFETAARWELLPLPPGVLPSALSLCLSFVVLFVVTVLTPPRELAPDVAAVLDS
jgi:Na+/proline symporter